MRVWFVMILLEHTDISLHELMLSFGVSHTKEMSQTKIGGHLLWAMICVSIFNSLLFMYKAFKAILNFNK